MLTATQVAPSEKPAVGFLNSDKEHKTTEGSSFSELFSMVSSESELSESSEDGKAYNGLIDGPLEASDPEIVSPEVLVDLLTSGPVSVIDSTLVSSEAAMSNVGSQLQALVSQLASREHMPKGHVKIDAESRTPHSSEEVVSLELASAQLVDGAVIENPEIRVDSPAETESDAPMFMQAAIDNAKPRVNQEATQKLDAKLEHNGLQVGSGIVEEALTEAPDSEATDILDGAFISIEEPLDDAATQETPLFVNPVQEKVPHESVVTNVQGSPEVKVDQSSVDDAEQMNLKEKLAVEQVSTANGQGVINAQGTAANVAGAATQASTQFTASASNASSNSVTHWGAQGGEAQVSQNSQGAGQSGQQPGQGQASQQQAMMFAQSVQEQKSRAIEQQQAVKAVEEAITKSEEKSVLGGAEIASADRRGALPLGLQTINLPVRHPQWGQALGQRVMFMAKNDLQQAQITLNPEKLGKIQVVLQLDKDQVMNVSLTAQSGTTREAIENALPRLREMLEQAGVNLGSVDVSEQNQSSENESESSEGDKGTVNSNLAEEESNVDDSTTVVKSIDGLVDYYV